jgi:hypothetical protein
MTGGSNPLRWFDGPPTFWKLFTGGSPIVSNPGEPVGASDTSGSFIEGIRCNTCNKIICEAVDRNKQLPE